jgi:hypothetical protein
MKAPTCIDETCHAKSETHEAKVIYEGLVQACIKALEVSILAINTM